jgi:hypothetical protein
MGLNFQPQLPATRRYFVAGGLIRLSSFQVEVDPLRPLSKLALECFLALTPKLSGQAAFEWL